MLKIADVDIFNENVESITVKYRDGLYGLRIKQCLLKKLSKIKGNYNLP